MRHVCCWGAVVENPDEGNGALWLVGDVDTRGVNGRRRGANGHGALNLILRVLSTNTSCFSLEVVAISMEAHLPLVAAKGSPLGSERGPTGTEAGDSGLEIAAANETSGQAGSELSATGGFALRSARFPSE